MPEEEIRFRFWCAEQAGVLISSNSRVVMPLETIQKTLRRLASLPELLRVGLQIGHGDPGERLSIA